MNVWKTMTKDEIEPYKYSKTNFQDEIECWV